MKNSSLKKIVSMFQWFETDSLKLENKIFLLENQKIGAGGDEKLKDFFCAAIYGGEMDLIVLLFNHYAKQKSEIDKLWKWWDCHEIGFVLEPFNIWL